MVGTFSAIGLPFSFAWSSPHGDPEKRLRCYPKSRPEDYTEAESHHDNFYELVWCTRLDEEDVFEDGWYLSGVGHHLEWCGAVLDEAVDCAQEHIIWDGSNASDFRMEPVNEERPHAYPVQDHVWQDDPVWVAFAQRGRTGREK